MTRFKAILWDCDGCLIDSELIACSHAAELFTQAGYPITTEDYILRFAGQGKEHIFSTIEKETGLDLRGKIDRGDKIRRRNELFQDHLKEIPGISLFLQQSRVPMAIASGSEFDRLEYTLRLTNLYDRFMPHIYSSSLVAKGKPAPDIFLYAADKLNVRPEDCLVIEDSENGVRAGRAAGMAVFGFTGGSHVPDKAAHEKRLLELGAERVLHEIDGLLAFL
jgi:HAD superfamily hydrolase (TIGR01509 family)